METRGRLNLIDDFPATSTEQWEQLILADLHGGDYEKKLLWKSDENIVIRPYYREDDLRGLEGHLNSAPGEFPFIRGWRKTNGWIISQGIDGTALAEANADARDALARGAEAITFHITRQAGNVCGPYPQSSVDLTTLTAGIDAPIHFRARDLAFEILRLLQQDGQRTGIVRKGSVDVDPLNDVLLTGRSSKTADELMHAAHDAVTASAQLGGLRTLAVRGWQIQESGGTIVQELAAAIAAAAEYAAALTEMGLSIAEIAAALHFDLAVSSNYFFEIAKLRALRLLWSQIARQFGAAAEADSQTVKACIIATSSRWDATIYDPHINLLRGTTKAMSAALGGADVIEILPFDVAARASDDFSRHLARNTQILLKKESYFDRVADAGAGSYYLESLTDSLAREAWKLFQKIEEQGGYLKALQAGFLQAEVNAARARKDKGISGRSRTLLGTNQFPNAKETALERVEPPATVGLVAEVASAPGITVVPLTPYRGAEGFENVRLRTERFVSEGGHHPRFLLLEYGDSKMRKARVGFSQNFLACGGFDVVTRASQSEPAAAVAVVRESGADAVVLCSSDDEYLPMAKPLIEQLGSSVPVLVAGSPSTAEQLRADGVTDFIHLGVNALDVLSAWQERLGVR
ncbi:MAG: methylmalonyl-CoA mutase family protein [Candidatus Velthaea sp.]|jgi:methylmalonyl-CoA mutase